LLKIQKVITLCAPKFIFSVYTLILFITSYWFLKHESVILQSGKSAAVYACAQEQGFEVLEVSLIINMFWLFMLSTDSPLS